MTNTKVKHSLREGGSEIVTKDGKPLLSGYNIEDLAPLYYEMKETLGDQISMQYIRYTDERYNDKLWEYDS